MYPTVDAHSGDLTTAADLRVAPGVQKLYEYIRDRGTIVAIDNYRRCAPARPRSTSFPVTTPCHAAGRPSSTFRVCLKHCTLHIALSEQQRTGGHWYIVECMYQEKLWLLCGPPLRASLGCRHGGSAAAQGSISTFCQSVSRHPRCVSQCELLGETSQ